MSANMLKIESKRRRTKAEVERERTEDIRKQSIVDSGMQQINQLQSAI